MTPSIERDKLGIPMEDGNILVTGTVYGDRIARVFVRSDHRGGGLEKSDSEALR